MEFVGLLTTDEKTQGQVLGLTKKDWDKSIIISDHHPVLNENTELIKTDFSQRLVEMKQDLTQKLKGKIKGTEVALSIAAGTGKEHMALISALLSIPVGIRFVALTKSGVVYL